MNREDREQFAERWLNETLARYSEAEPREGFERRILANLASHREHVSTWRRLVWVPVACVAIVALAVAINLSRPAPHNQPVVAPVVTAANAPDTGNPHVNPGSAGQHTATSQDHVPTGTRVPHPSPHGESANTDRMTRLVISKPAEPRKPQFPRPIPPTEQEQLLAAYLSATPTHELLAVAADQQQWREQVRKNAEAAEQEPAPVRDINHLQFSPPEGGTEAGAYGSR